MTSSNTAHAAQIALGIYGEELATRHLVAAGMRVVERNWRSRSGEIDVVALDNTTLVICEVKTRTGDQFGGPLLAVDHRKLARLRRLAGEWVAGHDIKFSSIRIDVIAITIPGRVPAILQHLQGVE